MFLEIWRISSHFSFLEAFFRTFTIVFYAKVKVRSVWHLTQNKNQCQIERYKAWTMTPFFFQVLPWKPYLCGFSATLSTVSGIHSNKCFYFFSCMYQEICCIKLPLIKFELLLFSTILGTYPKIRPEIFLLKSILLRYSIAKTLSNSVELDGLKVLMREQNTV